MTTPVSGVQLAPVGADWPPVRPAGQPAQAPAPVPVPLPVPMATPLPDPAEQARAAAQQLQEFLQQAGHDMKFDVDKSTGMTIVRIFNSATGELVRQIPSEEVVRIATLLREDAGNPTLSVRV